VLQIEMGGFLAAPGRGFSRGIACEYTRHWQQLRLRGAGARIKSSTMLNFSGFMLLDRMGDPPGRAAYLK
jgi:hypothetical protein